MCKPSISPLWMASATWSSRSARWASAIVVVDIVSLLSQPVPRVYRIFSPSLPLQSSTPRLPELLWTAGMPHSSCTAPGPLRAVPSVRVSTVDQASRNGGEGLSIPVQREANRRKAADLGALVAAEFVDRGRTGGGLHPTPLPRRLPRTLRAGQVHP